LEHLHEIPNKEIFFPDKYRMLFSSGDTTGREVNSILGQKINSKIAFYGCPGTAGRRAVWKWLFEFFDPV